MKVEVDASLDNGINYLWKEDFSEEEVCRISDAVKAGKVFFQEDDSVKDMSNRLKAQVKEMIAKEYPKEKEEITFSIFLPGEVVR